MKVYTVFNYLFFNHPLSVIINIISSKKADEDSSGKKVMRVTIINNKNNIISVFIFTNFRFSRGFRFSKHVINKWMGVLECILMYLRVYSYGVCRYRIIRSQNRIRSWVYPNLLYLEMGYKGKNFLCVRCSFVCLSVRPSVRLSVRH